ncbi:hypothetical protein [Parasitella parasitica]|uniref:G-protein coupled receptors family 1 profile domain-containing protein n=1 Tax=Parasitella parasitica TaxID=35722 RepID=A0A0B7NLW2_9FUNG|nr:hypothetical protein [Parasitella parasitica]
MYSNSNTCIVFDNLPWQFCYYSFACYLFGVAHTICSSKQIMGDKYRTLPIVIDIFFIIFTVFPVVITNTCSIAKGALIKQGSLSETSKYTEALDYSWLLYSAILALFIPYAGYMLIKVLRQQLFKHQNIPEFVQNAKTALLKIRMTMLIAIVTLTTTIIFEFLTVLKVSTSQNYHLTLAMYIVSTFNSTLASTLVIMVVLFNPKLLTPFSSPSSNQEDSAEHIMSHVDSGTGQQKN